MSVSAASGHQAPVRIAVMASAAAAVEWYDFFIYGTAAALVFPHLFFPADLPPFVAQIASFSTFAVGFIARPVGGVVFGHFGDIHGRKRALVVAMLIMGLSTVLIGLLPGYASIGLLAPLLLIVLRFAQGLAVGGQWGGAALLAIENAPAHRRGLFGSFVQVGVPIGVVLANLVFLLISAFSTDRAFMAWGWRIGFLASAVLIVIGLVLHFGRYEAEIDTAARPQPAPPERRGSPVAQVVRSHWREILLAGGAFIANNTGFYVAISYAVAYGTATVGIRRDVLLFAVLVASALMIPVLLGCGAASDRFGRRGVFMLGALLSGAWAFAIFPLIELGSPLAINVAISVDLLFISMMYGPQAALFAELFPKSLRYSGASLGYQIGAVVGGGFAPVIATALYGAFRSTLAITIYLSAMCAISFLCVAALGRNGSTDRAERLDPHPGNSESMR